VEFRKGKSRSDICGRCGSARQSSSQAGENFPAPSRAILLLSVVGSFFTPIPRGAEPALRLLQASHECEMSRTTLGRFLWPGRRRSSTEIRPCFAAALMAFLAVSLDTPAPSPQLGIGAVAAALIAPLVTYDAQHGQLSHGEHAGQFGRHRAGRGQPAAAL
jgi:hypothetical protein